MGYTYSQCFRSWLWVWNFYEATFCSWEYFMHKRHIVIWQPIKHLQWIVVYTWSKCLANLEGNLYPWTSLLKSRRYASSSLWKSPRIFVVYVEGTLYHVMFSSVPCERVFWFHGGLYENRNTPCFDLCPAFYDRWANHG